MLREILARCGIQIDGAPLARFGQSITGAIANVRTLGTILAGSFLVNAIRGAVSELVHLGDEADETARSLGLTVEEYQQIGFAARRSGVETDAMATSMGRLMRSAGEAASGSQQMRDTFHEAGVSFRDANGELLGGRDLLLNVADALASTDNASRRVTIAQQLLGRAGRQLIPLLENGREGVEALFERFEELGGGMGDDFVEAAAQADDAIIDFETALLGIKTTIAAQWLPILTRSIGVLTNWIGIVREATEGTDIWKVGMIALASVAVATGLVIAASYAVPLAMVALLAAAFLLIIIAVEDLVGFLEGKDSVIGAALDSLFGPGTADTVREFLIHVGEAIGEFVDWVTVKVPEAARALFDWFSSAIDIIKRWATAIGDTFTSVVASITAFVQQAVGIVGAAVAGIEAGIMAFVNRIRAGIESVRGAIATVGNLVGIDVGVSPSASNVAEVNQDVSVTVQNAQGGEDIENRIRRAITDANDAVFRGAARALTQLGG